jgi:sucrose-6-phosphate hydrolase SacC (GH32 family)
MSADAELAELLSEGLDLCQRARRMGMQDRANATVSASVDGKAWEASGTFARHAARHNIELPDQQMMTKSATLPLWVQDQYEKDLAEWERRARAAMMRLGYAR